MKRLCIFCKYFEFEASSPGYSEYTPGSDVSMDCLKSVWKTSLTDYYFDFNATIKTAQNCNFYERSKDAIEMGAPE